MLCAAPPPAPEVIIEEKEAIVPKFKVNYIGNQIQSRGLMTCALLEAAEMEYDFELEDLFAYMGPNFDMTGSKNRFLFKYLPEVTVYNADCTRFSELVAIATFCGTYAPKSSILRCNNPGDYGISCMLALKGSDLFSNQPKIAPSVFSLPMWNKDMSAVAKTCEDEVVKPLIDNLEKICKADGTFTDTGTSFGEISLWGSLYQFQRAKIAACTPYPPKLEKFVQRVTQLSCCQKVLNGQSKLGQVVDYMVPIPDEFRY